MNLRIAPDSLEGIQTPAVFLAGSIEQDRAEDWQKRIINALADTTLTLLNPRRAAWDASWVQDISNPIFREQVEWELAALERADLIVMNFIPNTQSPITLLELGLWARSNKLIVCCPQGFWRKGNVDIVCARYGAMQVESEAELVAAIRQRLV